MNKDSHITQSFKIFTFKILTSVISAKCSIILTKSNFVPRNQLKKEEKNSNQQFWMTLILKLR